MSPLGAEASRTLLGGLVAVAVLLALPAAHVEAATGGAPLVSRVRTLVPEIERAAVAARSGDPSAVQAQYDAARDLSEALGTTTRLSAPCRVLRRDAMAFAHAHVMQAEGFDMKRSDISASGRRKATAARGRLDAGVARCQSDARPPSAEAGVANEPLLEPRTGQAIFGGRVRVNAVVPDGAAAATVGVNGTGVGCAAGSGSERRYDVVPRAKFTTVLDLPVGSHRLVVTFCSKVRGARARAVATRTADRVWVLPSSSKVASPARPVDRALSNRLAGASSRFSGYSAVWYQDLRSGRAASWNAEARFPAASTVKLGVLIAALRMLGKHPERSRFAYDLETMIGWSSNLATNRLLRHLGRGSPEAGARASERALRQLGARSSTFTGEYRVGTSVARPSAQPPLVSSRVTTARDLGKVLFEIHAGAAGRRSALAALGLDEARAQLALGLLLASEPVGDNVGLVRGLVPPSVPIAQKHGWLRDARHTSAILYQPRGPEVVVVLTYRSELSLGAASAYAGDVLDVLRRSRSG